MRRSIFVIFAVVQQMDEDVVDAVPPFRVGELFSSRCGDETLFYL
jgi:hypothetical protein